MTTTNQTPFLDLNFETILLSVREAAHKSGETISRDEAYQRASVEQHRRRQTLIQAAIGVQRRLAAQSAPVVRASSRPETTAIGTMPGHLASSLRREVDRLTDEGKDLEDALTEVREDVAAFLDEIEAGGDEDEDALRTRTAKTKAPKAKAKRKVAKAANDADDANEEEDEDDETEEHDEPKPTPKAKPKPTAAPKPSAKAAMRDLGDVAREIQARDPNVGWESAISQAYAMQLTEKANASAPRSIPTRREIRAAQGGAK